VRKVKEEEKGITGRRNRRRMKRKRDVKKGREKTRRVFRFSLMYQYPINRNISSSSI
jgi:hypothetical protein